MCAWLIPVSDLTPDQQRAVELPRNEHRLVYGAPGSGKTMILMHRADYLRRYYKIPDNKYKIFVFTNMLKNYIKSALYLLKIPDDSVITFDSWCRNYYETNVSHSVPRMEGSSMPDFGAIRAGTLDHLRKTGNARGFYDFILADEAQDLNETALLIMRHISGHLTLCMDNKQQLYDTGSNLDAVLRVLGLQKVNQTLLGAYRCCPHIVKLASLFIHNEQEKNHYIRQSYTNISERENPLFYIAENYSDEMNKLIGILRTRLSKGEKIGIIVRKNKQVHGIAKGLREAGIEVESDKDKMSFDNSIPKIMTYEGSKGLTFETILLPRLVKGVFEKSSSERIDKLLFVGITRAVKWVYMSGYDTENFDNLKCLLNGNNSGFLTVQSYNQTPVMKSYSSVVSTPHDDLLDLL